MSHKSADVELLKTSLEQMMKLYRVQTKLYQESQQMLVDQKLKKPQLTFYSGGEVSIKPKDIAGIEQKLHQGLNNLHSRLNQLEIQHKNTKKQYNQTIHQLILENKELKDEISRLHKKYCGDNFI